MKATLLAEFRKLLSVRSTYIATLLALAIVAFMNFLVVGYNLTTIKTPDIFLSEAMLTSFSGIGILIGVVPILFVTHEYRYNTIYYTLTEARSRTHVLLAKLIVGFVYATIFALLIAVITVIFATIGLKMGGHSLGTQHVDVLNILWRGVVYSGGITALGMTLAFAIRNQIGVLVTYLIAPSTIENLASLALKNNAGYLPFSAMTNVVMSRAQGFSVTKSALIGLVWVVVFCVISWLIFTKRDAN